MIILASSSPIRQHLLKKLMLPFETQAPNIDETHAPNETPQALVLRLAQQKAEAVAKQIDGLIIASDQVATLAKKILTKPQTHDNAVLQLQDCSNREVCFYTSLVLLDTRQHKIQTHLDTSTVFFRQLLDEQIHQYLHKDQPYQCAGSFKYEGLGIALFKKIQTQDSNALMGLPLIALVDMLTIAGVKIV